jgi:hypothetical protein
LIACDDDAPSIGYYVSEPVVRSQRRETPASLRFPYRHLAVVGGGGQPSAIRCGHQGVHHAGVPCQRVAGLAGVRVPDPHRPVGTRGG